MTTVAAPRVRANAQLLVWAATLFSAAVLIHGADHVRRGVDSIDADVFWAGTSAIALEVGVVVMAIQRHRRAAIAATLIGASLAAGYVFVHFLPERSWLSDPLTSAVNVNALSWFAASLEVVAASALGLAGLAILRRQSPSTTPRQRDLGAAVVHPVALAMIAGNAVILAISLVQL